MGIEVSVGEVRRISDRLSTCLVEYRDELKEASEKLEEYWDIFNAMHGIGLYEEREKLEIIMRRLGEKSADLLSMADNIVKVHDDILRSICLSYEPTLYGCPPAGIFKDLIN